MNKTALGLIIAASLAGPAAAESWDTYYNMATFGVGGGSDEGGWFNFECADEESGFDSAGQPFFSLRIGESFQAAITALEPQITIFVDDGQSYVLPMRLEIASTTSLSYDHSAELLDEMLDFIAALRRGSRATAWSGTQQLASVALDGSFAALEYVEACVAGED